MATRAGALGLVAILLAALALLALACGSAGFGWGANGELLMLRLPRVLAALAAGCALGTGGANQQGVFRNPLADPGLTGVFGGALLGIALLLAGGTDFAWNHRWALPAAAFGGALATSLVLVAVGTGHSSSKLLLAGLGLNAFTAAGTLVLAARFPAARDVLVSGAAGDWLGSATLELAWAPILGCAAASLLLLTQARALDRLSFGEDMATCLGTDAPAARRNGVLLTAFAAAAATCCLRMWRGPCATGLPSITMSEASQPTSGFQGSWIRLSGSGTANMSLSAGLMSSQVAKPAKPAPAFCISPIARAGTSLARSAPNRST